jgi:hypothetical protein
MIRRIEAAKAAAPYMHARFSPTIYTPQQDQLEEDNTINIVFVSAPKPTAVDQSTLPDQSKNASGDAMIKKTGAALLNCKGKDSRR